MSVEHDRQKLVDWKHLWDRVLREELAQTGPSQGVTQSPVRIPERQQRVNAVHYRSTVHDTKWKHIPTGMTAIAESKGSGERDGNG